MEIYLLKIESESALINKDKLSIRARQRLKKITHQQRRDHIIHGDLLLQYVLQTNTPNVTFNSNGKPLLQEGFFSISNSKEWVLFAYSQSAHVGADIEIFYEANLELADYFYTKEEAKRLRSMPSKAQQAKAYAESWTFKESYVKCRGVKLMDIRHMLPTPRFSASFMQEKVTIEEKDHTYIRGVVDNYTWCVISEGEIENYSIKRLRIKDLVMNR